MSSLATISTDRITVRDVIDLYLRYTKAESVHAASTAADRAYTFRLFNEAYGDLPITECRSFHLTDFIANHPEWKSNATKRQKANGVRAAFNWAVDQERIDRNPFAKVRYAEAERREEMPDAVLNLITTVTNKAAERILKFIRLTGCRASEACHAVWADIDPDRGIWRIPKHKGRKRTGKPKVVALVPEAVELLQGIASTPPLPVDDNAPVFLNAHGRPFTRFNLWHAIDNVKKRAGIKCKASVHGIRHRAASAMVIAGAPLALVAAQLGHSTVQTTTKYYVHLENQMDAIRDAASLGVPKARSA